MYVLVTLLAFASIHAHTTMDTHNSPSEMPVTAPSTQLMYIQLQNWRVDVMLLPQVFPNPHVTQAGVQGGTLVFQVLRREAAAAK
jgi:hypothetical protein